MNVEPEHLVGLRPPVRPLSDRYRITPRLYPLPTTLLCLHIYAACGYRDVFFFSESPPG